MSRSPLSVKPTTLGVSREPWALVSTLGLPPSMTATTELVVPRSIPMIFAMMSGSCCWLGGARAQPWRGTALRCGIILQAECHNQQKPRVFLNYVCGGAYTGAGRGAGVSQSPDCHPDIPQMAVGRACPCRPETK